MNKLKFIFNGMALLISANAFCGGMSTGGGGAIVCYNQEGSISSAQLLDLYEAQKNSGLDLITSSQNTQDDFIAAVIRTRVLQGGTYSDELKEAAKNSLNNFYNQVQFVNEDLPLTSDHEFTLPLPKDCRLAQLAIYNDKNDQIKIDQKIWSHFSHLDQAALVTHEALYKTTRDTDLALADSEFVRESVGLIYSKDAKPVINQLPPGSLRCMTGFGDVSFFVVKGPQSQAPSEKEIQLQVTHLGGIGILTHSVVALKGITWDLKKNNFDQLIVNEEDAHFNQLLPIKSLRKGLSMEVKYNTGRAVQINIYRNNHILSSNLVTNCQ